jgi:hypothetical protein
MFDACYISGFILASSSFRRSLMDKLPLVDLLKVHPWLRTKEPTDDVDMVTHKVTQKAPRCQIS